MPKKKLTPKQNKGINRSHTGKPLAELSEEKLTEGWAGFGGAQTVTPNIYIVSCVFPFAGDDEE
ncbi:MAG: hypothetical protein F6K10_07620 [Moorea sp. SIO2B7]|nr:hypothetical protein [Moorena sp. SIO2B7]